jgi:hypothetical protein
MRSKRHSVSKEPQPSQHESVQWSSSLQVFRPLWEIRRYICRSCIVSRTRTKIRRLNWAISCRVLWIQTEFVRVECCVESRSRSSTEHYTAALFDPLALPQDRTELLAPYTRRTVDRWLQHRDGPIAKVAIEKSSATMSEMSSPKRRLNTRSSSVHFFNIPVKSPSERPGRKDCCATGGMPETKFLVRDWGILIVPIQIRLTNPRIRDSKGT